MPSFAQRPAIVADLDRARLRSMRAREGLTSALAAGPLEAGEVIERVAREKNLDRNVVQQALVALLHAGRVYLDHNLRLLLH